MSSIFDKVQPAVKKETRRVVMITAVGLVLMWILFAGLHFAMPDKVPLDYTVFLGGIGGGLIAVLNFFLMGLAVQKAASATDEGTARMKLKASYSQRFLMMMLWVIAAIVAPCFHFERELLHFCFRERESRSWGYFINKTRRGKSEKDGR